ncbi:MAG TPA: hypothetical protein VLG11_01925 [Candidatus Saccharimonadales bacterium]|nr:hypothetical protein [Candidatus Saccharimonadales bacterium]
MSYEITHRRTGEEGFGFEIQPPLTEIAANGLRSALLRRIPGENHLAPSVDITRSDEAGTALDVQVPWTAARLDSGKIADQIATLLNPGGKVEVTVLPSALPDWHRLA